MAFSHPDDECRQDRAAELAEREEAERPMTGDEERLDAARRYAAGLELHTGEPHHVDTAMRGWLRIFRGRSIVYFVGSSSGGVYEARSSKQYGRRVGNVFAFARRVTSKWPTIIRDEMP